MGVSRLNETEEDPTNVMPLFAAVANPACDRKHVAGISEIDGRINPTL
jgi:hypothetical protein